MNLGQAKEKKKRRSKKKPSFEKNKNEIFICEIFFEQEMHEEQ